MSSKYSNPFWLILLGVLSCGLYAGIGWQSQFFINEPRHTWLIPVTISLFGAAFIVYLLSIFVAVRAEQQTSNIKLIWAFAIGFRLLLLLTEPILEIDIYRYLWDGRVLSTGVSPYRYSPQQILDAKQNQSHSDNFQKLIAIRDASPSMKKIIQQVHFRHLTTVYPPVSQIVFAAAQWVTPQDASVVVHLSVMKGFIVLFDLLTIFLLIKILQLTSKPIGWVVAYAWSPLVMKEFANSGHLDSITVCLTTAAIYFVVKNFSASSNEKTSTSPSLLNVILAAFVLALAVGAKLYPVILFPLMFIAILRHISFKHATLFSLIFFIIAIPICWQMVTESPTPVDSVTDNVISPATNDTYEELLLPVPPGENNSTLLTSPTIPLEQADAGLKTFLSTWEMNDLLFMCISENLKPDAFNNHKHAWFVMSSEQIRSGIINQITSRFQINPRQVPFLIARVTTTIIFLVIVMFQIFPKQKTASIEDFLQAAFLIIAWFWLLLPTQNPWYWIWAMPLLPFAKNRVWLMLSGVVFIYYLRFWIVDEFRNQLIWGTQYAGAHFFDYVIVWFEYVPFLIALLLSYVIGYIRFRVKRSHDG